ncbi:S53 family peptidase [Dyella silvatica]|uniref:S53 family peptidase n=1 Tax=Dyella silvatica TaxID=2992128 RepID=UPI00224DFADE|nr:protease pro-enzyme activation domain-containing protein [Dyella silvatica]
MRNEYLMLCASIAVAIAGLPVAAMAQPATSTNAAIADLNTVEMPRVTKTVDSSVLSTVAQSHLGLLAKTTPTAVVADSTPMNHMQLILQRSALREGALNALISAQHDPKSPKFHTWLTPQEYGATFGVAEVDIAAVKSWLSSQGFTVHGVYPNKMQIDFSGTAGMVKRAFHTQENHYTLNKVSHIANASDISVPTALKDVVVGVAGLNDLRPQALHVAPKIAQFDATSQKFKITQPATVHNLVANPEAVSFQGGVRGLVPYDTAKMYGVDQLRASGITGKGITIAVVEDGSMVPADWTNFVSQFNLASYGGTFAQIQPQATPAMVNCIDPTIANPGEDDTETLLDAEWSTAIAPGANIVVASCDDSNGKNFFGGVFTAATNLINGASRPNVISASYGYGEGFVDAASKTAIDLMWAQADVEGISVFVSTGDSGTNPSFNGSVISGAGLDANAFATSPNVTGVGGTDTADVLDKTSSKYFSKTTNSEYGSALSYIPEIPWNQSCGNSLAAKFAGQPSALEFCKQYLTYDPYGYYVTSESGSGGPSSVDRKPAWQRQVHNAAKDQSRDLPDVSLFAGSYGGYTWVIICTAANPCVPGFTAPVSLEGGTSLSSPMFAGIQALIDQGLAASGLPAYQGNAAPTLYALAAQEYGGATGGTPASLDTCNSDNGAKGTGKCVFHNVTRSGISTQCIQQLPGVVTADCYFYGTIQNFQGLYGPVQVGLTSSSATAYTPKTTAYSSQQGWSFAAGLGSVNAKNLLTAWKAFDNAP